MSCIILTQNDATVGGRYDHWEDATGIWYHFPNQYLNRISEADRFVYYRGSLRADGSRGAPGYFGCWRLGEIWRDTEVAETEPKRRWRWYVEIDDYEAFDQLVPIKSGDDYIEDVRHGNHWGTAVRQIDQSVYDRFLELGGVTRRRNLIEKALPSSPIPVLVDAGGLFRPTRPRFGGSSSGRSVSGRSAKRIGDRAEKIVFDLLREEHPSTRWVAQDGEKPGWDIEYKIGDTLVCVEVKGTTASRFTSIEVTANEWAAADLRGTDFYLYLVADALGAAPKIEVIRDPVAESVAKSIAVKPISVSLRRA